MNYRYLIFWSLSSLLLLSACEKSSTSAVSIPNVQLSCTTSDDPNCSSSNPNGVVRVFVRMTRSGCGTSIDFEPVATGDVAMNCDASGCDGVVTSWTDPETLGSVTEVITGDMDICSQVDLDNSSGLPNTGDLINQRAESIVDSSTIGVDTWSIQ